MGSARTLIIGGGQAGLATAYCLQRRGAEVHVLEAHAALGDNWRRRWIGLRLFTPNRYNCLPGSAFPGERYGLPDRCEVGDYLEAYAKTHGLAVSTNADVVSLTRDRDSGHFWLVTSDGRTYDAPNVVIAAGAYRTARVPGFAERLPAPLPRKHTSQLRDLSDWPGPNGKRVLIVGAGASGSQVAELLSERHEVILAGRDPGALPRRLLGRDIYDYLYGLGLMGLRPEGLLGRLIGGKAGGGEVGVGESADELAKRLGIRRCARIDGFREGAFVTSDGESLTDVDAVIFATGYDNRYPFVHLAGALDVDGKPLQEKGVSPVEGLFWAGLPMMRRFASSLLGGVGADAQFIAQKILERSDAASASSRARSMA